MGTQLQTEGVTEAEGVTDAQQQTEGEAGTKEIEGGPGLAQQESKVGAGLAQQQSEGGPGLAQQQTEIGTGVQQQTESGIGAQQPQPQSVQIQEPQPQQQNAQGMPPPPARTQTQPGQQPNPSVPWLQLYKEQVGRDSLLLCENDCVCWCNCALQNAGIEHTLYSLLLLAETEQQTPSDIAIPQHVCATQSSFACQSRCPLCGAGASVVPIVYGFPSSKLLEGMR